MLMKEQNLFSWDKSSSFFYSRLQRDFIMKSWRFKSQTEFAPILPAKSLKSPPRGKRIQEVVRTRSTDVSKRLS